MTDIVLSTLNARFIHAAFGLRYLWANLGELKARARIREFVVSDRPIDIVEQILAEQPRIVGLGVYIWNCDAIFEVVSLLKTVQPDLIVVLGGPEVSHETDQQPLCQVADYVITGEGEWSFARLCADLLRGERPSARLISGVMPELSQLALPYDAYDERDVRERIVYVEASRGCPYQCEFCLSALDKQVRNIPLPAFLQAMDGLFQRGVRHFKFVDRTFNLSVETGRAILDFFYARYEPGMFLHFEMVPDRLPDGLREAIARFPAGALQFEIGIQTFDPDTSVRISRRQNIQRLTDNFAFLTQQTGVHIHADLIVGLPGESMAQFATGFDRLFALGPHEIQIGILKRLRGAPIARHTSAHAMRYSPLSPYEVLATDVISFSEMQQMKRFARYWDVVSNSGRFGRTRALIWQGEDSVFWAFLKFSSWLFGRTKKTHEISLERLLVLLAEYLTDERGVSRGDVARALFADVGEDASRLPEALRVEVAAEWQQVRERRKQEMKNQRVAARETHHERQERFARSEGATG